MRSHWRSRAGAEGLLNWKKRPLSAAQKALGITWLKSAFQDRQILAGTIHQLLLLPLLGPADWIHTWALAVPGLAICESNLDPFSFNPNVFFFKGFRG